MDSPIKNDDRDAAAKAALAQVEASLNMHKTPIEDSQRSKKLAISIGMLSFIIIISWAILAVL